MKESILIARTLARNHLLITNTQQYDLNNHTLSIASHDLSKMDIHLHAPSGAVGKDGPSAGVAITVALLSALLNIPAKGNIAMTGEIDLLGNVLPVGGIKEKLLAAHRAQIMHVILPEANQMDLQDVPKEIRRDMQIDFVNRIESVLDKVIGTPKLGDN